MGVPRLRGGRASAVFLDRDGVINRAIVRDGRPYPPRHLGELEIPDDVPGALAALKAAGLLLIVVTNQPDVSRGTQSREAVEQINAAVVAALPLLDTILVCYHADRDGCECRKPAPGLLLSASQTYGVELPTSFVVGDRWRDIEAGRRAGCVTVWIDRGYREPGPSPTPDHTSRSLGDAARWILSHPLTRGGGRP
jgi:D-glycero-D-manno-heptose 1,7-bisphosphate phosphatase